MFSRRYSRLRYAVHERRLEPTHDDWPLFQRRCYLPSHGIVQRYLRFCNPYTSHALCLEATSTAQEEDTHDVSFCDRVFVSNHSLQIKSPSRRGYWENAARLEILICSWRFTEILPSACITSILRTYYTWKIVQSPDISYNMVPMGMWTYAELSTGIVISCLPVIPKFFQQVGPKLSSALTLRSKSAKDSGSESTSAAPSDKVPAEKLKLPSFKHTLAAVAPRTQKDHDLETYDQETLPKEEYVQLDEETALPRRDATRELIEMAAANLATTRDELERGYGRF